jgi:tetratricopeptide (TPR) repeat protein
MITTTSVFICQILIIGIFVLPYNQDLNPILHNKDAGYLSNVIAYMNYFLTLLATLGTISGLAFTIFGYYQSTKVPQMVKEEVKVHFNSIIPQQEQTQQQIQKLQETTSQKIKALQLMLEPSILGKNDDLDYTDRIKIINTAQNIYPNLWRSNYYKAKINWNEFEAHHKIRNREAAMDLMNRHIAKYPEHSDAWVELINWLMKSEQQTRALTNFEKMMEYHPELVTSVETLIDWSNLSTEDQHHYKEEIKKKVIMHNAIKS